VQARVGRTFAAEWKICFNMRLSPWHGEWTDAVLTPFDSIGDRPVS
jgi:hypothetical protein